MNTLQVLDLIIEFVTYSSFALFGALFLLYVASGQSTDLTSHTDDSPLPSQLSVQELVNQADAILLHPLYAEPAGEMESPPPPANGYPVGFIAQADPFTAQLVNAHQVFVAHFWRDQYLSVLPAPRAATTTAKAPTVRSSPGTSHAESLRKLCSVHGIRWRNAQPNGKHLTVSQMRQLLTDKAIQHS